MNYLKKYKMFESNSFNELEEILNEFCDSFNLDLIEDNGRLYPDNQYSNGSLSYKFVDRYMYETENISEFYKLKIHIKIKDSFRIHNEEKIDTLMNWIIERIDEIEIRKGDVISVFYCTGLPKIKVSKSKNPITEIQEDPREFKRYPTKTVYEICFDIIKKVL